MTKPFLSVVMPSFNGARWIAGALDSVWAQADPDIELIIVDGNDDEETERVVDSYRSDLNIKYFRRPDLGSWQAKTNFAVSKAAADYIAMLHVDDLWLPGRTAVVRKWIQAAPAALCHLSPSQLVDASGRKIGIWRCPFEPSFEAIDPNTLLERLLVQNFISCPAPVIARRAWLDLGGVDEDLWYTADWDFYLKIAAAGPVVYHSECLTAFRIHGSSLTVSGSRNAADFREQLQTVLDRHLPKLAQPFRDRAEAAARASISINVSLAGAANGSWKAVGGAAWEVLSLGPAGIARFLRDTRLKERLLPRVRAKMAGGL